MRQQPGDHPARRRTALLSPVALLGVLVLVAAVVVAGALLAGGGNETSTTQPPPTRQAPADPAKIRAKPRTLRLVERRTGSLQAPVQDAAVAAIGGDRAMLLGGLTEADISRSDIRVATPRRDRPAGSLPLAVHDAAAVRLGSDVYVFGGGTNAGTQTDAIVEAPVRAGTPRVVGRLPAPSSDQAAAAIDGIAYVVGGYTGARWLDSIVAWRPGTAPHVVARLPFPLRYAAVGAADGRLVIAGGSLENGTASSAVLEFTPGHGRARLIGRLRAPTTHAASATLGGTVFVIGGRGANVGSATGRIVAVDPRSRRVRPAGTLATPRSDLAAVSLGGTILVAGGRGSRGAEAGLSELTAAPSRHPQTVRTSSRAGHTASVYAFAAAGDLSGAARLARPLVYVPNSQSATVDVIDPATYKVVEHYAVGLLPQHVVPSYDLRTLYVTNDIGNSLTAIDPRTGRPVRTIPVDDPYNMYFTPGGKYAIVVAERLQRLDFRNARTFALHHSLPVPCVGIDHMDFSRDGSYLLASCEFSGQLVKIDVRTERVVGVLDLPDGRGGEPQDVRISPDGRLFYVADLTANGVWKVNGDHLKVIGFVPTGKQAHGLYPSRDGNELYVSNRGEGSVSVISFRTQKEIAKWRIPGGGSPDMGGVSADGRVLWLSGRYNDDVYAISTRNGALLARIPVGAGPHGLCVWPQPGRYSLGHTGNMR